MPDIEELTILLVEDDEGHAELIKTNLKRGCLSNEVIHFSDGQQAVDFLFNNGDENNDHGSYNYLMLLDLNMPVMDGYQVLERIKSDGKTKLIPIVILTTTEDKREVNRCYELGCNVYISKPVEYPKFSSAIRELGLLMAVVRAPEIKESAIAS